MVSIPLLLEVYPRVCGGTSIDTLVGRVDTGLSPRVRGNPIGGMIVVQRDGSIPACAGEPTHNPFRPGRCAVYPRVCGGTSAR